MSFTVIIQYFDISENEQYEQFEYKFHSSKNYIHVTKSHVWSPGLRCVITHDVQYILKFGDN